MNVNNYTKMLDESTDLLEQPFHHQWKKLTVPKLNKLGFQFDVHTALMELNILDGEGSFSTELDNNRLYESCISEVESDQGEIYCDGVVWMSPAGEVLLKKAIQVWHDERRIS